MIAFQEGRCAICGVKEGDQLHIDHDHSTGKVRGLLCFNCNSGLGQFQDDQQLLYKASDYLKSFAIEKIPKEWLTGL